MKFPIVLDAMISVKLVAMAMSIVLWQVFTSRLARRRPGSEVALEATLPNFDNVTLRNNQAL